MKYTIVSSFIDIGRQDWNTRFRRNDSEYLSNAKRMLSLKNRMVLYVCPKVKDLDLIDFIKKERQGKSTIIVPTEINDLPAYKYHDRIKDIMNDPNFQEGLRTRDCPEVCNPSYDVIMFSKVPLIVTSINEGFFPDTTHWIWMDFGIHKHMLQDQYLGTFIFDRKISDKVSMLCRSVPQLEDLDIEKFFKSHTNRFAGTFFSASKDNMIKFNTFLTEEIESALLKRVIDCDQSFFSIVYLKHRELFSLYYGDWENILTNYQLL